MKAMRQASTCLIFALTSDEVVGVGGMVINKQLVLNKLKNKITSLHGLKAHFALFLSIVQRIKNVNFTTTPCDKFLLLSPF